MISPSSIGRFDDCPTIQIQDAGRPVDLRPEDGLKVKLVRQAALLEHLPGQAKIGFILA